MEKLKLMFNLSDQQLDDLLMTYYMDWWVRHTFNPKALQVIMANRAVSSWYNHRLKKQTEKFLGVAQGMEYTGALLDPKAMLNLYEEYLEHGLWKFHPDLDEVRSSRPLKPVYNPRLQLIIYDHLNIN